MMDDDDIPLLKDFQRQCRCECAAREFFKAHDVEIPWHQDRIEGEPELGDFIVVKGVRRRRVSLILKADANPNGPICS
jgi:hypothetical protein